MNKFYPFFRVIISFTISPIVGVLIYYIFGLFYSFLANEDILNVLMIFPMIVFFGCLFFSPVALIIGVILIINRVEKSIGSIMWTSFGGVVAAGIMGGIIGSGIIYFACLGGISAAVTAFSLPSPEEMEKRRQM